jgi:beta-glucosidase
MVTDLGDFIVAQGKYTVSIGNGQPGTGVSSVNGNLEIKGTNRSAGIVFRLRD